MDFIFTVYYFNFKLSYLQIDVLAMGTSTWVGVSVEKNLHRVVALGVTLMMIQTVEMQGRVPMEHLIDGLVRLVEMVSTFFFHLCAINVCLLHL